MTPEEQNFYYFKLHDTNNDNHLDGLEVVAAFNHVHQEENQNNSTDAGDKPPAHQERMSDDELMRLVDDILKEEDADRDGYISYDEFKRAIEGTAH